MLQLIILIKDQKFISNLQFSNLQVFELDEQLKFNNTRIINQILSTE